MPAYKTFLISFLLLAAPDMCVGGEDQAHSSKLALGVNYLGGQIDYQTARGYRFEMRYLTGKQNSDEGRITSSVLGMRLYRVFRFSGTYRPYCGLEADYVRAKVSGNIYDLSGIASGVYGGIERRLYGRLWAGADVGPYLFSIKEKQTGVSNASVEFVANAFMIFYLF